MMVTPKSSIFIGFSIINHPFWGTIIFGNTHMDWHIYLHLVDFMVNVGKLGGETSNIFYFHPDPWGNDPIWRA